MSEEQFLTPEFLRVLLENIGENLDGYELPLGPEQLAEAVEALSNMPLPPNSIRSQPRANPWAQPRMVDGKPAMVMYNLDGTIREVQCRCAECEKMKDDAEDLLFGGRQYGKTINLDAGTITPEAARIIFGV